MTSDLTCPACGAELEMALTAKAVPVPEPIPVRPLIWTGPGLFDVQTMPTNDAFLAAMRERGLTNAVRYQTTGFHNHLPTRGFYGIVALGPTNDPDYKVIANLDRLYAEEERINIIHLWDEKTWDDKAFYWCAYIWEHYPRWLIAGGPFDWKNYDLDIIEKLDFVISYQNCTRAGRSPLDIWFHRALANRAGREMIFSCNVLDQDSKPATATKPAQLARLADGGKYGRFIWEAAQCANGVLVWGADAIRSHELGKGLVENPEDIPYIYQALLDLSPSQAQARPRKKLHVFFTPGEGTGWCANKALCRIAALAGYEPVARMTGEGTEECIALSSGSVPNSIGLVAGRTGQAWVSNIADSTTYADLLSRYNDPGRYTLEIDAALQTVENNFAAALAMFLGGRGDE
ncbi:MAG: hypothetical protein IMZ50_16465 [Candidatus Atribacteria bacterium]|nr:hypothetical protein [Candidatus Atribacteria bacterium]